MKSLLIIGLGFTISCASERLDLDEVFQPTDFEGEDFGENIQAEQIQVEAEQIQVEEDVQETTITPPTPPAPHDLIPAKATLWWIGYDFQRENQQVGVEIVTKGSPQYDLLHERNLKQQPELIVRFFDTSIRPKIRRDVDASEFPSPVSYIRTRQNSDGTVDVILTLREPATPQLFAKEGNLLLTFDIPERYLGASFVEREPEKKAIPIVPEGAVNPQILPGSDSPLSYRTWDPTQKLMQELKKQDSKVIQMQENASKLENVPEENKTLSKGSLTKGTPATNENMKLQNGNENSEKQNLQLNDLNIELNENQPREFPFTLLSVAQENFEQHDDLQLDKANLNNAGQNIQLNEDLNLNLQEETTEKVIPTKEEEPEAVEVTGKDQDADEEQSAFQPISIEFKGASLREVIRVLSAENQVNFIIPDSISSKKVYLKLQDVPWDEALQAIMETHSLGVVKLRGDVLRIDSLSVLEREKQDIEQVRKRAALVTPTKVLVVRLSYAKAKDMVTIIRTMLPSAEFDKRVKVEADERTNSIIVEAIPQELSKVRALIERVDLQTPQVKVETRVIEVLKDVKKFFGINWGGPFLFDQGRGLGFGTLVFPNNLMSAISVDTGAGDHQNGGRFDVNIGSLNNSAALNLRLRMSELSNHTRSLQNNSIIVLDHETASIEAGQEDYFQIPTGEGQTAMSSVKYALSLKVTPHITADGSVQMKVTIENSAPKTTTNAQASTSKSMRTLTTNLLRQSGETAVIGGLYTTLMKKTKQGLPILSDIPFIGWLFRSYNHEEDKRELIIMVTPTILASAQKIPSDKLIPSPSLGKNADTFQQQADLNLSDQAINESLQIQSQQEQKEGKAKDLNVKDFQTEQIELQGDL